MQRETEKLGRWSKNHGKQTSKKGKIFLKNKKIKKSLYKTSLETVLRARKSYILFSIGLEMVLKRSNIKASW